MIIANTMHPTGFPQMRKALPDTARNIVMFVIVSFTMLPSSLGGIWRTGWEEKIVVPSIFLYGCRRAGWSSAANTGKPFPDGAIFPLFTGSWFSNTHVPGCCAGR